MQLTYQSTNLPNTRLHVADALRGIAIIGIILLHNIEHMNFYRFPEVAGEWMKWLNTATWDGLFFAFGGKMYSIFALMFGLSFFVQNDNRMQLGKDFTLRFLWRMVLLMMFGLMNTFFYNGDILFSYAMFGMLLPFVGKLNTKAVAALTCFLLLQPIEIYQTVAALFNPDYRLIDANSGKYFAAMGASQEHGTIWKCGWDSLKYGQMASFAWNIENGRTTQLPGLFFLGMLLGRLRLFYNEKNNLKIWLGILAVAIAVFSPVYGLYNMLPRYISREEILIPVRLLCKAWSSLAQTFIYVSGLVLLFYSIKPVNRFMTKLTFIGRASMTNYFLQSALGAMLYYGWGFALFRYCGPAVSFLIGIGMVLALYFFCRRWFRTHDHGPMEGLWKKLTWMKMKRKENMK
ncbi:MAG: DUF418 domain-containing protein [Tannerella sp.]|jgi:uncharacterized protein|nr:DUF418 domain-containing protein [Tannerella sp.]